MATSKQTVQNSKGSPERHRRTDAKAPAQGRIAAQTQQQVATQIEALVEQLEQAPESNLDQWYAENFGKLTQTMDRVFQLLGMPTADCESQAAIAKKEESL
ncbi:MAG: hypothetical protein Q7U76_12050 [Nitrospirota bacterium]|nr:hypothetical protein [Nitrospirota bacterium]